MANQGEEDGSVKFLNDLIKSMNQGNLSALEKLPDELFCNEIASYFDHKDSLLLLAMLSRSFYVSMQLKYKSLCLINKYITNEDIQRPYNATSEERK